MAGLFKNRPEWLFTPESKQDLATALEYRLAHRGTNYTSVSSWREAAEVIEDIVAKLIK
jgi:hypothetical protein